ncbi:MAG: hypothetical protein KY463_03110 [Actinobacteria bacterium]|nr:hypothetical protein [Actinomycetota bacterium]
MSFVTLPPFAHAPPNGAAARPALATRAVVKIHLRRMSCLLVVFDRVAILHLRGARGNGDGPWTFMDATVTIGRDAGPGTYGDRWVARA